VTKGVYVEKCCLHSRRYVVSEHLAGGNERAPCGQDTAVHCGVVVGSLNWTEGYWKQ